MQLWVVGPSVVGTYYGPKDEKSEKKGDFGRATVRSRHRAFPRGKYGGGWSNVQVLIVYISVSMHCSFK